MKVAQRLRWAIQAYENERAGTLQSLGDNLYGWSGAAFRNDAAGVGLCFIGGVMDATESSRTPAAADPLSRDRA